MRTESRIRDFLTTKAKTTLREAQALNYALLRCLQNPRNNTLRGALIGCIAKIIDLKKHSLTKDSKALKLSAWNLLFVPAPLLRVLVGALLVFFYDRGRADLQRAEGGPVGAAIMTGMVTGVIANIICSAVQLASAANQSFDVPTPVKSFYTGGIVPLKEGNQFMISGAMDMEEHATVRGGNLYIDNAVTTRNLPQENQGLSITVQNMTVQTADPEDFAEQMKNLFRREQYL